MANDASSFSTTTRAQAQSELYQTSYKITSTNDSVSSVASSGVTANSITAGTTTKSAAEIQQEYLENVKVEETTSGNTAKSAAQNTVNKDMQKTDVFYLDVKVYLEGVQVPHSSCAVSYGIDSPPTASIVIPASAYLRQLPETTKITIVFRDLLPDSTGAYKYRLLFDGELSNLSYGVNASGASISIQAIHSTAYLSLMQLMTQAASQYLYDNSMHLLGNMTMISGPAGYSKVKANVVNKVIEGKCYKSMADIVYILLHNLLEAYKDVNGAAVAKWYWWRLGNDPGGYKILNRMYGVSDLAKAAELIEPELRGNKEEISEIESSAQNSGQVGANSKWDYRKGTKSSRVPQPSGYTTGSSVANQMHAQIGKTPYYLDGNVQGMSGTGCVYAVSKAMDGTPYAGIARTDDFEKVAVANGDYVGEYSVHNLPTLYAGDVLILDDSHMIMIGNNNTIIQNGTTGKYYGQKGGVYEVSGYTVAGWHKDASRAKVIRTSNYNL